MEMDGFGVITVVLLLKLALLSPSVQVRASLGT